MLLLGCSGIPAGDSAQTVVAEDAPCQIVIEHLTLGDTPMPDLQKVADAVSAITLPEINCTVKIENIPISDHATRISLMSAQNDQLDIINTGRTVSLSEMVADGTLLPLDDLLTSHGSALLEKAGDLIKADMIDDHIYSVPANLYCGGNSGFLYNKDMADRTSTSQKPCLWKKSKLLPKRSTSTGNTCFHRGTAVITRFCLEPFSRQLFQLGAVCMPMESLCSVIPELIS